MTKAAASAKASLPRWPRAAGSSAAPPAPARLSPFMVSRRIDNVDDRGLKRHPPAGARRRRAGCGVALLTAPPAAARRPAAHQQRRRARHVVDGRSRRSTITRQAPRARRLGKEVKRQVHAAPSIFLVVSFINAGPMAACASRPTISAPGNCSRSPVACGPSQPAPTVAATAGGDPRSRQRRNAERGDAPHQRHRVGLVAQGPPAARQAGEQQHRVQAPWRCRRG